MQRMSQAEDGAFYELAAKFSEPSPEVRIFNKIEHLRDAESEIAAPPELCSSS